MVAGLAVCTKFSQFDDRVMGGALSPSAFSIN